MIGKRFKEFREAIRFSQKELADKLNLSQNSISKYENEYAEISNEILIKLMKDYHLNSEWLLTGVGNMFQTEKEVSKNKTTAYRKAMEDIQTEYDNLEGTLSIPILDLKVSAGYGKENYDENPKGMIEISKRLLNHYPVNNLKFLEVFGDSMMPTFFPMDWVCICEGLYTGDGIYILNKEGELFLKRLQFLPDKLIISSDNNRYKPIEVDFDNNPYTVIGKVVLRIDKNI